MDPATLAAYTGIYRVASTAKVGGVDDATMRTLLDECSCACETLAREYGIDVSTCFNLCIAPLLDAIALLGEPQRIQRAASRLKTLDTQKRCIRRLMLEDLEPTRLTVVKPDGERASAFRETLESLRRVAAGGEPKRPFGKGYLEEETLRAIIDGVARPTTRLANIVGSIVRNMLGGKNDG